MDCIYSIVKRVRIEQGITQQQMADRLHLVVSAYGKIERGATKLTIERLREIAIIFDLPVIYFVSPETKG